jgi:hypothetical protein
VGYLLAAIAVHALMDGGAVAMKVSGVADVVLEAAGLAVGLAMLFVVRGLKEPVVQQPSAA